MPIKCRLGIHYETKYKVLDALDHIVLESSESCTLCNQELTYWAHGNYMYSDPKYHFWQHPGQFMRMLFVKSKELPIDINDLPF